MSAPQSPRRTGGHAVDGAVDDVAMVRPYLSHPRSAETRVTSAAPDPTDAQGPLDQDPGPEAPAALPDLARGPAHPGHRRATRSGSVRGRTAALWLLSLTAAAGGFLWWVLPGAAPEPRATVADLPADGALTDSAPAARPTATASTPPGSRPPRSAPSASTTPAGASSPTTHGTPSAVASAVPGTGPSSTQEPPASVAPGSEASTRGHGRHRASTGSDSRDLGPGDRGANVTHLQNLLYGQGKTYVAATGVYDSDTERAVRDIQQEYGITSDPPGYYGPATRAALDPSGAR